jgi:hypothetical protein
MRWECSFVNISTLGAGERIPGLHEERIRRSRAGIRVDVEFVDLGASETYAGSLSKGFKNIAPLLWLDASVAEPELDGHFVGLYSEERGRGFGAGAVRLLLLRCVEDDLG